RTHSGSAELFRNRASRALHGLLKLVETNLASRSHLKDFIRSHAKLVSQRLINRQTAICNRRQNVVLCLTCRGDLIENAAHFGHVRTSSSRRVSNRFQDTFKLLAWLNASSNRARSRSRRLTKAKGRTLNRSQSVIHDRINTFSVITQTRKFSLRVLNTSKTSKTLSNRARKRTTSSKTNTSNTSFKRLADAARNLRTNGLTNVRAIARGATKRLFDTRRNLTGIRNNANVTNG